MRLFIDLLMLTPWFLLTLGVWLGNTTLVGEIWLAVSPLVMVFLIHTGWVVGQAYSLRKAIAILRQVEAQQTKEVPK